MRDLVLTAFILGSIPFILRRPQLGVLMYVWISVMNPHRLTWTFAHDFPFAHYIALATLIGMLFSKDVRRPPADGLLIILALLAIWTGITTRFAIHPRDSYPLWETFLKTQLIAVLIPMLFHRKEDLRALVWVLVLSIAFYGTKGGLWTLLTGGVARVYGPLGSYIEDNNSVAAAIVMMIPLMRYLQLTTAHKGVQWGLTAMMLLCAVAALGTYSRGALLAMLAMAAFIWWKGRHKVSVLIIVIVALPLAFAAMPEQWHTRMETIKTYDEDSSARMRFNSWETMWNLARDRPLTGGGFNVASREIYGRYSPDPSFPPQVAHSIYFQAMGEHGFVGLALYLLLLGTMWYKAGSIARVSWRRPELELAWARDFGLMLQVSLVGFAVGGAFLSLVNFDVPYYLVGITVATVALVAQEAAGAEPEKSSRRGREQAAAPEVAPAIKSK